ncbi:MAG: GHKL domain-containing protein [Lachnospiraceae bacterium]|nr:GHKL domain-containing protein [Lachnospiraceae bacterium]
MSIQQYLTESGMQFFSSVPATLLAAFLEWFFFLYYTHIRTGFRKEADLFSGSDDRAGKTASFLLFAAFSAVHLWLQSAHWPIAIHCVCSIALWTSFINHFSSYPWNSSLFESSIFCLLLELGKSICRGGTAAYALSLVFPGLSGSVLAAVTFAIWILYMIIVCLLLRRLRFSTRYLQISTIQTASLLFPLLLYLYIRQFQSTLIGQSPSVTVSVWLQLDFIQLSVAACSVIVIYVTTGMLSAQMEKNELLQQRMLAEKQHRQYLIQKESMDAVNRKYHDLKHYLAAMESDAADSSSEEMRSFIRKLRHEIEPYETIQETGSRTMNILLAERIRECQEKQIRFTPFINASGLAFMHTIDLCTLFGNAMDNAIEASMQIADPEKREISVKIGPSDSFMVFRFQNRYEAQPQQKDSRFLTSKSDASSHGFGLESIKGIAEKYGGSCHAQAQDHVFILTVLVPARG